MPREHIRPATQRDPIFFIDPREQLGLESSLCHTATVMHHLPEVGSRSQRGASLCPTETPAHSATLLPLAPCLHILTDLIGCSVFWDLQYRLRVNE